MSTQTNGIHHPTPSPVDPAWKDAVKLAGEMLYEQARYRPTVHYGMEIVLEYAVLVYPDNTASVLDNGIRFHLDPAQGLCDCDWEGYGNSLCSHLAALAIEVYATQHLTRTVQPAAPALPESPISMNTHITIDGRPVQVTVRSGATSDDYHRVLTVMRQVVAEHSDTPMPSASALPAPAPAQIEAPQAQRPQASQAPMCPVHGSAMKPSQYEGFYCPRKNADGTFCTQKANT